MPTESAEIIENEPSQQTVLPAEEELTPLPESDETVADKSEDRDTASDQ